jgi:hypothetical protein
MMHTEKPLLHYLLCTFIVIVATQATCSLASAEKQKVYFAGFAFLSDRKDAEIDFAYSRKIFEAKDPATGQPRLNAALLSKLQGKTFGEFDLVTDALGDHLSAGAVAMAIALDWENINTEVIDGKHKVVINLHGQVLLFDYKEKKILAGYPAGVRINDVSDTTPNEKYLMPLFEKAYFEHIGGVNVLDAFADGIGRVKLKEGFSQRIKISEVVLDEKSNEFLPQNVKLRPEAYKAFIAQQFGTFLSSNLGVAILPYSTGEAIGNTMACRFQNGSVFNLTIPKEDIPLKITLRGFKKVKMDENVTGSSWAYGAFIQFSALNPFKETILNARFKNAAVKIVPASQTTVNDWPAFQESMLSLFDQLTRQIAARESSWIDAKCEDKDVKKQLKDLEKALKRT